MRPISFYGAVNRSIVRCENTVAIRMKAIFFALILVSGLLPYTAHAKIICTVVIDATSGRTISEEGDCDARATPASTFKVALALIGFDAGVLKSAVSPKLPFKKGYVDWRGEVWRQTTSPTRWMKYSVVWYSQQIAKRMGVAAIEGYLQKLDYGNADFSGDKGKDNALERAWISSSLEISAKEQARFLMRMLAYKLPVARRAVDLTKSIVETTELDDGWRAQGKTGSAYLRQADGSLDRTRMVGWFVGWATRGDRRVVFARLIQDEKRQPTNAGPRARKGMLKDLPRLGG